jgi:hypothetical protein
VGVAGTTPTINLDLGVIGVVVAAGSAASATRSIETKAGDEAANGTSGAADKSVIN